MEDKIYCIVNRLKMDRLRRRRFAAILTVLSMIVTSSVFWQLRSTGNALTDELLCGQTEHIHDASCITQELSCSENHEHMSSCYKNVLTCEKTSHVHTALCRSDISADVETTEVWEATLPEETSDDIRENIAAVAASQLGYSESTKNFKLADDGVTRKGYTRYGAWYGNPYGDWNALFAYFCLYYSGVTEKELIYGSGCWAWTEQLKRAELYIEKSDEAAKLGDIVFFDSDGDGKPDRTGIVSKAEADENGKMIVKVIEGDLENEVKETEYDWSDEKIVGHVSVEAIAETKGELKFPTLQITGGSINLAAANNNRIYLNGNIQNNTSVTNPYVLIPGEKISLRVSLNRKWGNDKSEAYYSSANNYKDAEDYQLYPGTLNNETHDNHNFYTPANIYSSNTDVWGKGELIKNYVNDPNPLVYRKDYTVPWGISGDYYFEYNNCDQGGSERFYVKVIDPNAYSTKVFVTSPEFSINNYRTEGSAYELGSGDSVELTAYVRISEANYQTYGSEEEWNNAKTNFQNQGTADRYAFVKIGDTYVSTNARFWGGDVNDGSINLSKGSERITNGGTTYSVNGDYLVVKQVYTARNVNNNTKGMFHAFFGYQTEYQSEDFWINVQPDSTAVTEGVSFKMINPSVYDYTDLTEVHPYTMYAAQKVTVEASTPNFEMRTTDPNDSTFTNIGDNLWVKTNARFWSFNLDETEGLKDTLIYKTPTAMRVEDGLLYLTTIYTANEVDKTEISKITFYDGGQDDDGTINTHYYPMHIEVQEVIPDSETIYVKTEIGYKDMHKIHEWLAGLYEEKDNAGGYIRNSPSQRYFVYPGEKLDLYAFSKDGIKFDETTHKQCTQTDGSQNYVLWDDYYVPGEASHDIIDDLDGQSINRHTFTINPNIQFTDDVMNHHWDEGRQGIEIDIAYGDITFYVLVKPYNAFLDHADIEISDSSRYTASQEILQADGTKIVIDDVYDAVISDVYESRVYKYKKDADGNVMYDGNGKPIYEPLERMDDYALNGTEYSEAMFRYIDYVNNGESGGTQFEYTSKSFEGRKNGYDPWNFVSHVHFSQALAKKVNFDVQLTLTPSHRVIKTYDKNGKLVKSEQQTLKAEKMVLEHVQFPMEGQSVLDAVNKCPNHSGLDFTVVGDIKTVANITPAYVPINANKTLTNGTLQSDQFSFVLQEISGSTGEVIRQIVRNSADGNIVFDDIEFVTPGNYTFILSEIIPEYPDSNIAYDTTKYKIEVEVTFDSPNMRFVANTTYKRIRNGTETDITTDPQLVFNNTLKQYTLPSTGGSGTTMFFIVGPMLMLCSMALIIKRKRKESV